MDWIPNTFRRRAIVYDLHGSHAVWHWPTLESIWADVRFALRQMRRSPGFTAVAVLTMSLAIGANAVVFGVINRILLHPLDVPDARSL